MFLIQTTTDKLINSYLEETGEHFSNDSDDTGVDPSHIGTVEFYENGSDVFEFIP